MANDTMETLMSESMNDILSGNISVEQQEAIRKKNIAGYMEYHLTRLWKLPVCECQSCAVFPDSRKTFRDIHHILFGMASMLAGNTVFIELGWVDDLNFLIVTTMIIYNDSIIQQGIYHNVH